MPKTVEALCLPMPDGLPRVESGPVQFGEDWPGYFLRGDNVMSIVAGVRLLDFLFKNPDLFRRPSTQFQLASDFAWARSMSACLLHEEEAPALPSLPKHPDNCPCDLCVPFDESSLTEGEKIIRELGDEVTSLRAQLADTQRELERERSAKAKAIEEKAELEALLREVRDAAPQYIRWGRTTLVADIRNLAHVCTRRGELIDQLGNKNAELVQEFERQRRP